MANGNNIINSSYAEKKRSFPEWGVAKARSLRQVRIMKKNSAMLKIEGRCKSKKQASVDSDSVIQSSHLGDADVVADDSTQPKNSTSKRQLQHQNIATQEERAKALKQAMSLQGRLESGGHCSFVKSMLKSNVYKGFWMNIPTEFSNRHLNKKTPNIWLEDEEGEEFKTIFKSASNALSGGWRKFSMDHELQDGDALVFKLIRNTRFKVYIFRGSHEADERNAEKLKKPRETKSNEKDCEQSDKPRGKRTRTLKKADIVIKKVEAEEAEPKQFIERRKKTEKLLTKKHFDLAQVTDFRRVIKNLGTKKL